MKMKKYPDIKKKLIMNKELKIIIKNLHFSKSFQNDSYQYSQAKPNP